MRPQLNEPCNNCKHWSNRTGCKIDRYNSTSMVMFGHCGFRKPKRIEERFKVFFKRFNRHGSTWVVWEIGEDVATLVRADVYCYPERHGEEGAIWRVRRDFLNFKNFDIIATSPF